MHNLRLTSAIDRVVEKNTFFEEHVHLIVFWVVANVASWLFEDIKVEHLTEICHVDLVNFNRILGFFLWQQITIAVLELVNKDLVALHVDSTKHAIIRNTHYDHLILVVTTVLLLQPDALGGKLGLGIIRTLLLGLSVVRPLPEGTSIQAGDGMLLV